MGSNHIRTFGYIALAACLLGVPSAYAAEVETPFVVADIAPQKRFIPLRSDLPRADSGLRTASMRSDRTSMNNGFMRLDRSTLRPTQTYRHNTAQKQQVASVESQVRVIRPAATPPDWADNAVTDLFGDVQASGSFTDTMKHADTGSSGAVRHSWPVSSSVKQTFTSGYGMRKDPFHGRQKFHGGIDIAAATGTPILASAAGVVTKVAQGKGLGKYVAIQHRDGTESYYGHLSAQHVRVGQPVYQGQKVGALGSTGRSTGPHLDYRIKKNGATFNPMTVLRQPSTRVASR